MNHCELQVKSLSDRLHRHTDFDRLWADCHQVLTDSVAVSPVHVLFLGVREFAVAFRGSCGGTTNHASALKALEADCALLRFFRTSSEQMFDATDRQELIEFADDAELLKQAHFEADTLAAQYVFAIRGSDRVLGFLAVGAKSEGSASADILQQLANLTRLMGWAAERVIVAAQAAVAEKHALLAIMSRGLAHDLNNLLTPISTLVQLDSQKHGPESQESKLLQQAKGSLRVIRDYLDDAIFFAKEEQPQFQPVNLTKLLEDVVPVIAERAHRANVTVHIRADDMYMVGDYVLCQRMLVNLVSNAIDASSPGQMIMLEGSLDRSRKVARLVVQDSGTGIPVELQRLVFEPYFTTKDTGEVRGFGLGLTVCQRIAEMHQGIITLESNVGAGTRFVVELPLEMAAPPGTRSPWPTATHDVVCHAKRP